MKAKNIINSIKTKLMSIKPMGKLRLFLAWLLISALFIANSDTPFTSMLFFKEIKLGVFIPAVTVLWVILCKVGDDRFITVLLLISSLGYILLGVSKHNDFSFAVGGSAVLCLIIYMTDLSRIKLRLRRNVKWMTAGLLIGGFTAFVGIICCLYYFNHWTPCFDFGLFSQMFHHMKESGLPLITCERDHLLSHFAVHFSPVFYLLLPFFWLIPSPCTLLVMQALIVASGVIPLMLICKDHKLSEMSSCGFAVIYTLYPCFAGGCFYYLHENNFLAPLILWLVYFCEKGRTAPKIVFLILLLSVKEDAAVYAAVISLYFLFTDKNYKCNLFMLIFSVIYFVTVTKLLALYGEGVMTGRYGNYDYDNSGSLLTVIWAAVKNPVYVVEQCFTQEKLIFSLQMLLPLGFLPFMTKRIGRYLLLLPFILVNLMSNYQYQHNINYQYCFGSGALLIYLSVINFADIKNPKLLLCSVYTSVTVFFGLYYNRLDYFKAYAEVTEQRTTIDRALSLIPEDASVISSTFFIPNLSQRDEIYELERTDKKAEYYVLDLRYETEEYSAEDYLNSRYETVFYEEGAIGVFRDREYIAE